MTEFSTQLDDGGLQKRLGKLSTKIRGQVIQSWLEESARLLIRRIKGKMAGRVLQRRSGRLSRSVKASRVKISGGKGSITVGSNVKYAPFHEFGTGIHGGKGAYEIVPIRAKALRFVIGGETVFAKRVLHPGVIARPIWRPALKESKREIKGILASKIEGALGSR